MCVGSWSGEFRTADENQRQFGVGGARPTTAAGLIQTTDTAAAPTETVSVSP